MQYGETKLVLFKERLHRRLKQILVGSIFAPLEMPLVDI